MNKACIIGRLAGDPELRHTSSGIAVTSFTVAVDRPYHKDAEKQTDWIDVVAWRGTAEFICKYFGKGSPIVIDGPIQTRNWEDKDGIKRKSVEIVADNAEFVPRTKDTAGAPREAENSVPISQGYSYQEPKEVYGGAQSFVQGANEDFEQVQMDDEDLPF